ncbi:nucleotidyltransferase domain-containing protein [uncultured Microbacterium sp.]|uniref:nucleotidyltransferase domain-containing protein n=2 Tax=Microbacterium TaxID=33882 RepID=UPI0028EBB144|nr:nucleotidyltransferase domain-containing protein [uncultured Microbacterium sp.]
MQHADLIERFIASAYPRAEIAIVAGSTARGERTASSDIDLLLIGDALFDDSSQSSKAATHEFEGELIEVFAYTPDGFDDWAHRGIGQYRPVIVHMLVEEQPIRRNRSFDEFRARWSEILTAGPSLGAEESRFRRYMITDLLDDLRDATDELERRVVADVLFERIAELMLLGDRRWIATGKWLPRRLRALSEERTERLSAPLLTGDFAAFADRVEEELDRAGGRLQAGFVR